MEDLGFDLGEPHPPRRARTFVGQTAGCRTKVHLAPVRRRVQFRHPKRASPLLNGHFRNEKSRADSPPQYYENLQGLKSAVVGHTRPPEDTGNQPPKTALPCGQMDSNRHMTAWIFDGEEISPNKYFRIYRFPEFWNSGSIHSKGDSYTSMNIELKIQHDQSSTPQIFKR